MRRRKVHNDSSNEILFDDSLPSKDQFYNRKVQSKKQNVSHLENSDYQPASYRKACQFRDARSYKKKMPDGTYKQIGILQNTDQLKAFGLGPYFYIQFIRRCVWLFFFLSIIECVRIYIFFKGSGLYEYKQTLSTYLIKSTISNFNKNILSNYDNYIVVIIPGVVFLATFLFFLIWKGHYFSQLSQEEQNDKDIKPQKFCVQVQGEEEELVVKQSEIEKAFIHFGPLYQVSLVRRHKNKLEYFEQLDELDEQIKEEQLELILGSGDKDHCKYLKKQREELQKYIQTLKITPKVISAYLHFQFQKSKVEMLSYYNDHYLFNTCMHSFMRCICCCCFDPIEKRNLVKGKILLVKNDKVPSPQDINWESKEISCMSKFCRVMLSILIIILFLVGSCVIIGLCSIYISSSSTNCTGISIPSTTTESQALQATIPNIKTCFCSANIISSFNSNELQSYCGSSLLKKLYVQQAVQYAVVATSSIVNVLFGLIVHWLVNFSRPQSFASGALTKSVVYTSFLILNSIFLPLLIYANIFGFKANNYVSLLTIISNDISQFFNVSNISLHSDFNQSWYRTVSPIFTNFVVIDILTTWALFIFHKCKADKQSLEMEEGLILQKHMNQQITSYKFNIYSEYSYFNLIIIICVFFSPGIPILIPLGFFNLLSKYIYTRSLIQKNSTKIQGLGSQFNSIVLTLFPLFLIASCIFGGWMLTYSESYYPKSMKISILNMQILSRQLYIPYLVILALVIGGYLFLYNTLIRFCSWLTSSCYTKKQVIHPYHTLPFSQYVKKMNIQHSYNIRNNDKLKNVINNLQKYLNSQEQNK